MKKIVIAIVSVLLIGGAAFYFLRGDQEEGMVQDSKDAGKQIVQDTMDKGADAVTDTVGSVVDKIQSGVKMQCTYEAENEDGGKTISIVSVEGDKYHSVTTVEGYEQHALFDGEMFYSWGTQTPNGFKMDPECMEGFEAEVAEDDADARDYYNSAKELVTDFPDIDCKPTSDIDFSIPEDVEFVDQCEMLKKQMDMLDQMEQGTLNMEEFQNMMPQ